MPHAIIDERAWLKIVNLRSFSVYIAVCANTARLKKRGVTGEQ